MDAKEMASLNSMLRDIDKLKSMSIRQLKLLWRRALKDKSRAGYQGSILIRSIIDHKKSEGLLMIKETINGRKTGVESTGVNP